MMAAKGVIENILILPFPSTTACSLSVPLTSCQIHGPISRHLRGVPDGSVTEDALSKPSLSTLTLVSPSKANSRRKLKLPARLLT